MVETQAPELSVVVAIIDGGDCLRDFLRAALAFADAPAHEIIVPYDQTCPEVPAMQAEFPAVRFLDMGHVATGHPVTTEAGRHELYDRRKSFGLKAARGRYLAILEDRGHPRADWARAVVDLHKETGAAVVGGAIECREPAGALNWTFYVTDFSQYGLPVRTGPATWISDVNVSYTREALEATKDLWTERYHEPIVHEALMARGDTLWLSDRVVIFHGRPKTPLGYMIHERFHWGRLFGHIRTMTMSEGQRWKYILLSPLIPPVLWLRHGMTQRRKGRGMRYLRALPYVMILTTAWTAGEVWGYITRRP
ncbi:hypothetical protein [Albidovulum sp.]|uniref:hypothetical protein n=1 Tax=Albidovulum sp. TaxID=1872424 RepID=UPI0039B9B0A0